MKHNPRRQEESQAVSPSTTGARGASVSRPAFFLLTKLLPPRPAPALLERPRLIERLAGNLASPVTLVTANAGSGKTTLVAGFVRAHAQQFVWYQLDHTDADPAVFLGYITYGIRQIIPDFGQATLAYLRQSAAEAAQHPERAVDVLLNEVLGSMDQQLILVLDDYHHLGVETPVHAAVDRLLAYLPDVMHTIIISREAPPLQSARLRSQARLSVIDRNDLLFTDEETRALFHEVFGLELTPHQLAEYRERTQGWITALQLVRQVAQRQMMPDLGEILRQSESDIFDYFAEEVFADESVHVQQLLLRLSLLERIDPETCGRLYPEADCSVTLPALVRRNVFMTIASNASREEYRLHPLFRSFLRRRLRSEVGRAGVAAEQTRIASYLLERGNWEQAIHHLLAAEDFDRAAELIAEKGQAWVAGGALALLVSSVDALPAESLERHPRALAARAEVARLRGEYDAAQGMFRRAAHLLHARNDREGEAEALHSLATIARRRGDFTAAFDYLDRAIELTDERSAVRAKCGNTRGLCLVAMRQWTEAEREFRTALHLAEERRDEHCARIILHNLGLPPMIRGDFGEALRSLRRLLRDEAAPVPQEATAHTNMARCHLYRGEMAACERHLERALEYCQLFNLIAVRAEVFETYGNLYRERGDATRAEEFYERAARAYEEAGIAPARCELLEEQALLKLQMGDGAGARALLDRLIEARAELMDEMGVRTAMLSRGRVLLDQNESEQARTELEQTLDYFRRHKLYYYEVQACLALARCDHAMEREGEMMRQMRRVLDLAARYDYEYWLQRQVAAHPQLFLMPDVYDLLPPDLREQAAASSASQPAPGLSAPTAAQQSAVVAPAPLAGLTINMLGPVEIFRDPRRPFAADAWTTKRARDILCFIVSRRHRRASKDTIIETFWGEADPGIIAKNFHPTVSHIRKALNSNQPLKQNFLLYRDGDYLLNSDFSYAVDIEEFDRLVAEAGAARRAGQHERCIGCYEEAIKLYRGEFMQNCYDEWVEEQRSYYREQYMHMLEALVVAAQKAGEWLRSLQVAQQILRADPFCEDIHCLVMRAHASLGNRVAVKEQYETLRRIIGNELGVEPAAETQKIYRQLIE